MACRTNFQKKFEKPLDKPLGLWYNEYIKDKDSLKNQKGIDTMSTSTVKKLTKRDRFEALLKMTEVQANPDMVAFIEHEIELLAKKNAGDKKPTAKQMENDAVKQVILDEMTANPDKLYTVTDLIKGVPELADYSNQRISALLRQMINANGVERIVDKRKSYFRLA